MSLNIVGAIMSLAIESYENRGDETTPFGYVYFTDGTRVGYSPGTRNHDDVWEPRTNGNGKFAAVTQGHLEMAAEYLTEKLGTEVKAP